MSVTQVTLQRAATLTVNFTTTKDKFLIKHHLTGTGTGKQCKCKHLFPQQSGTGSRKDNESRKDEMGEFFW